MKHAALTIFQHISFITTNVVITTFDHLQHCCFGKKTKSEAFFKINYGNGIKKGLLNSFAYAVLFFINCYCSSA